MPKCPSCNNEVVPGTRWCRICYANVVSPQAGRLAAPIKRLGAHLLDLVIPLFVFATVLMPVLMGVVLTSAAGDEASAVGAGLGGLVGLAILFAYIVGALLLFSRGTTPGKFLLGMRVVKEDGSNAGLLTMLIREWVGKWISGFIFALGFLWILIDQDRQGWHDKLMSTYVVN